MSTNPGTNFRSLKKRMPLPCTIKIAHARDDVYCLSRSLRTFRSTRVLAQHPLTGELFFLFEKSDFKLFVGNEEDGLKECAKEMHLRDAQGGATVLVFFLKKRRIMITVFSDNLFYADDCNPEPIALKTLRIAFIK